MSKQITCDKRVVDIDIDFKVSLFCELPGFLIKMSCGSVTFQHVWLVAVEKVMCTVGLGISVLLN